MDQFTSSFHGRLLNEGAEISLNYGNRYGLLGENGSRKVGVFVTAQISAANALSSRSSIAERDIEIPPHIYIYIVRGEAEPSDVNAVDFIIASAKAKVARLEEHIRRLTTLMKPTSSLLMRKWRRCIRAHSRPRHRAS